MDNSHCLLDKNEKIIWLDRAEPTVKNDRFELFFLLTFVFIIGFDIISIMISPFIGSIFGNINTLGVFIYVIMFIISSNLPLSLIISHLYRRRKIGEGIFYLMTEKRLYIHSPKMRFLVKSIFYDTVEKEFYSYINDSECDVSLPEFEVGDEIAIIEMKKIKQIEIKQRKWWYDIYMYYFEINYTYVLKFRLVGLKDPSKFIQLLTSTFNYMRICENVKFETYMQLEEVWREN